MRVHSLARIGVAAAGVCLALAGLLAGPAQAAGHAAAPAARPAPAAAYYSASGQLTGVAAVSANSAWAVGYTGSGVAPKVLMVHWNGTKWSRATSPAVLTRAGELTSIKVVNAKDAWAAGYTGGLTNTTRRTLLLHWNGRGWSAVTRPAPIPGFFDAVTANASGGWAMGGVPNGHNFPLSLAVHLHGTTWSRTRIGNAIDVVGVAITAKNSAWAIGFTEQQSELAHWNGSAWSWKLSALPVKNLYELYGIAAGPRGAAFVVGHEYPAGRSQAPVSLKLVGSAWKQVPVRAPAIANLNAVSYAPGGAAWAAGTSGTATMVMRWNGKAWTRVASPSPGSYASLYGLGFASARNGWAVGSSGTRTLILHWNGSTWK